MPISSAASRGAASSTTWRKATPSPSNWDPVAFPSCIVWISNAGRKSAPWNGRHLALGIEPVCSALGLGNKVSQAENPLVQDGEPTAARFRAGEIWRTHYRLSLEPLA